MNRKRSNIMAYPEVSMRELISAGVHFGHKTRRWNPRMAPFIYGVRNDTHIIDLGKTVPLLHNALSAMREVARNNGKILFVGTKRQASDAVEEAAKSCSQYYVNQRWLGGMMTNWKTIQNSIKRLREFEELLHDENTTLTKKELLMLERNRDKLQSSLGGIRDMNGTPDMMFIVDVVKEDLAVTEAQKLGIPIVAIVDTNASIDGISYPIPGNDDASRAIRLYCELAASAIQDGREAAGLNREEELAKFAEETPKQEAKEEPAEESKKAKSTTRKDAMKEAAKVAKGAAASGSETTADEAKVEDAVSSEHDSSEEKDGKSVKQAS
jgi:small subunit ribosomal protein S2